ncbi:acetolactate synthase small subunit [Frateuria aurantia]|uniref:Acetolactate synthase small subunit n=1 Tax=Frateuria aurantia (strain ATCC 33424 / DSM 6220 / KCTC 2777 / LMG 1558 / NBRC 3245 / NCIMB 13370) TaxID=767434 RepID=H8L1B6_FRAAD|nr:acetolactate synthase small subunit [Frateuria aurantia]AFC87524.1 acetolactate synthase, small subunit [Frateuria aurantia DSM 6220]
MKTQLQPHIITILLDNEVGALARVAGLFAARGYNIDSLSVAATADPSQSRLTLTTHGDTRILHQVVSQLRKLVDVLEVQDLTGQTHLESELLIINVRCPQGRSDAVDACLYRHRAFPVAVNGDVSSIQFAGTGKAVRAFLDDIEAVAEVLVLARSGTAALQLH